MNGRVGCAPPTDLSAPVILSCHLELSNPRGGLGVAKITGPLVPGMCEHAHWSRDGFMGLQTSGRRWQRRRGALAGVYDRPVGRQDLGAVRTRVLELFLLQRAVQVAADSAQLGGDGRLAEVRAHRLRARGASLVRASPRAASPSRAQPALTSTMCSLGSRPQSASVSWSLSRKRRRDSRSCGSRASSCSRGVRR